MLFMADFRAFFALHEVFGSVVEHKNCDRQMSGWWGVI